MFKNYFEVRDWVEEFIPLSYDKNQLGLARIENLLKLLGNPERKFKSIHIAGTSGKGSTAWYTAKLLQLVISHQSLATRKKKSLKTSDLRLKTPKIGLHISPHLVDIRERLQINGELIPMTKFIRVMGEIKDVVEKIQKQKPDLTPSYFEILVAASFLYFAQEKVDWAVVEVGLGGRLDATNVLSPQVSAITNVGLDHTEILGTTVVKIAYEKAGIIKPHIPIVTGASGEALKVIADVASKRQASLVTIDTQNELFSSKLLAIEAVGLALNKPVTGSDPIQGPTLSGLPGRLEEIDTTSPKSTSQKLRGSRGLRGAGRVILDGAHNPDKIRFLIDFVRKLKIDGIILVLGFKKGKDWKKMVDLLVKNLPVKQVIATKYHAVTDTGVGSGVEPEEIGNYVAKVYGLRTTVYSNSQEAVFEAIQSTDYSLPTTVLVTGSLYLVGEVRTMWKLPSFA